MVFDKEAGFHTTQLMINPWTWSLCQRNYLFCIKGLILSAGSAEWVNRYSQVTLDLQSCCGDTSMIVPLSFKIYRLFFFIHIGAVHFQYREVMGGNTTYTALLFWQTVFVDPIIAPETSQQSSLLDRM